MAAVLQHRGPDSAGAWADAAAGIALGHRRLSIVDLSPAGHQPMISASGRYVLSYNGEIYNHAELRAALAEGGNAPAWAGTSDTETLLAAIDAWGLDAALARAAGMFAFALWDRSDRRLSLVRDRLGEKPLYFGRLSGAPDAAFGFASELRALRAHPDFDAPLAGDEVSHFTRHGFLRAGASIHRGIFTVRPGEIVELAGHDAAPRRRRYWDGAERAVRARATAPFRGSEEDATDRLETLLSRAVADQMVSDVPLGAFLSGGIDSSTIVALMQQHAARPVRTFSIGFAEARYDEADHARAVAAHLGTEHTELTVTGDDLRNVVPRLPEIFDEPFGDGSMIPTYLVSRLARASVTVSLSGDGGDELFGGYDRYRQGARLHGATARIPHALRRAGAGIARAVPRPFWNAALAPFRSVPLGKEPNGQWAHRMAAYAAAPDLDALHRMLVSKTRIAGELMQAPAPLPDALTTEAPARGPLSDTERMMQLDLVTYLPGDILTKVDRASMAVSLESRAPLLDHRVAEFAFSLPPEMKAEGPRAKWVLRKLLHRHVPPALVDRPKMGFEVPISAWLRGELRDWAGDLLCGDGLAAGGIYRPRAVAAAWDAHQAGRADHGMVLWHVAMFEAWRRRWL